MESRRNIYELIYPDGRTFPCTFGQVMERLTRDFVLMASRDLVQKRIVKYKNRRVIASELIRPATTRREAGAIRWDKTGVPCINSYSDVEGIDGPISARQVWKILVVDTGRSRPGRETVRRRLKAGARSLAELFSDCPTGRPKGAMSRKTAKAAVKTAPAKKETLTENTVLQILHDAGKVPGATACGHVLPAMKTWEGWDRSYYRRGEPA